MSVSSSNNLVSRFPPIEHPTTKRFNSDPNKSLLDIRGKSRDGFGNGQLIRSESSASSVDGGGRRRRSSSLRQVSRSVDVNEDRTPRLPIFGQRPSSIVGTPRSDRIRLDELEMSLREKVRSQFFDVKVKFRHAADSSTGMISRAALQHFIASIFGTQRQVSPQQIEQLIERINLKQFNQITFVSRREREEGSLFRNLDLINLFIRCLTMLTVEKFRRGFRDKSLHDEKIRQINEQQHKSFSFSKRKLEPSKPSLP